MAYGDKVKVSILETNGVDNFDGPEERDLKADIVDFPNAGTSIRGINVDEILKELRKQTVLEPQYLTTSLNGFEQLDITSHTLQIVNGSALGYSIVLPDATTLHNGAEYLIINDTVGQDINVKDASGTILSTLNSGRSATTTLKDGTTVAGEWFVNIDDITATGILNYNISSDIDFVTDSVLDVLIPDIFVTPQSGTYAVWFSSDIDILKNNDIVECVVYKDGLPVESTRRSVQGVSVNFQASFTTIGTITVNGSQQLDVRVKTDTDDLTVGGRSLILIRLG